MAFPDLFKLEKLKIHAYSNVQRTAEIGGSPFEAMFNPQTLSQTRSNLFSSGKAIDGGTQSATFSRAMSSELRLNLLLDGSGVGRLALVNVLSSTPTVQDQIDNFLSLAYKPQSDTHEPSFLKVQWGKFTFECRLATVTVNYTSFNRDGSPLRAELDLTLTADADIVKQQSSAGLTSPDVSHARLVRGGDTLPQLTRDVYGSTDYVLRVARSNGLDSIRGLTPGRTLIFPPLAR